MRHEVRLRITCMFLSLLLLSGVMAAQPPPAAQIKDGFTTTSAGIRIHYLEAGSATSAPALILIPGWRLPASLWNEQLKKFSSTTRVIAMDSRSQGESTKTADGNTPESRAIDLHDVLTNLHVTRALLVGWSQGAQDVAAYLQQFGTKSVAGIVLVDTSVSAGPAEVDLHKEFAKAIISAINMYETSPEEFSEGMVHSLFHKPHPELDIPAIVKFTLQTPTNTGAAMLVTDIFGADRRPALALTVPTLVIAAAYSPMADVKKEMAITIPGSTFLVFEESAHAVFIDEPEKFDETLQTFLHSLGPAQ